MPKSFPDVNLPIVGQGVVVLGYTATPLVKCDCGNLEPMQLMVQVAYGVMGSGTIQCPRCQSTYRVVKISTDEHGQLLFTLDQQKPLAVA
jgi:hypothetical protein